MDLNPSLAALLRQATRDAHRRLDQHRRLRPLLDSRLTLADYQAALLALYPAQHWLEQRVQQGLQHLGLNYSLSLRAGLLAQDLAQPPQPGPATLAPLPLRCPAQLMGHLYVLEGARLGSRVIARQVRRTLGPQVSMQFFSSAEQAEADWPRFWQFAARHCAPAQYPYMVDGALAAFDGVLTRLDSMPGAGL